MATYTSNYGWTKPSGSDNVDISVLNNNLDDQDSTIHDAFLNMAVPFSESSTYAVDDIVLYGTGLYKCHTAVVTPGSWTGSTNWQVYKLSEGGSGGGGTSNYNDLTNKPSINGVTLSGNKTTSDLGITASGVGAIPSTDKGASGGVAELDSNGKVPSSQLPSYVDDVLSYASQSAFPATGETGKIYIAEDTNKTYRWSGSAYAEISASLALGETSSTAYRGDRGKTAYDHSQTTGNPHNTTKSDVGLGNVPNVSTNDQTPTFTEASTRNNIASGEKLSVIFGKIAKFFNDLKSVAYSGSYTDLSNKPQINSVELSGNKTGAQLGLQNALTFDNVPTANSTNPVKSGGVYSADEAIRQWTTAEAKSVSGNPITLTDGSARNAEGLVVTCNPKQNLHGYDHPWAGGAGKNKLPMVLADIKSANTKGTWSGNVYTVNGGTFTINTDSDGNITSIKVNGTFSASTLFDLAPEVSVNGRYTANGCPSGGAANTYRLDIRNASGSGVLFTDIGSGFSGTITNKTIYGCIRIEGGTSVSNKVFYPMIRLSTITDATFEPYTNECPIEGYTECVVEVKDEEETTQHTATITFGQTVYGGSVDFKTGKVTVTHASIASYNGESINEPWLSSIDEYVSGTTPTTGAQVVYPLTEPIELTLTPAQLELLKGYNYITTNGTTIALNYLPDSLLAEAENYVDAKIPPAPSSDGTYVLTCTVTSGTPAYSWESAT